MCVNIRRGGKITVTEPFLNLLHRHAAGQHHTGAAVAKIVEPNFPEAVFLQKSFKVFRNIVRTDQIADAVDTDVVYVLPVVAFAAYSAVFFLLGLQVKQPFPYKLNKRQRPST